MDGEQIYVSDQHLVNQADYGNNYQGSSLAEAENKFMHFIRETQVLNTYIYRDQLQNNAQRGHYSLKIEMEHLQAFDDDLVKMFRSNPQDYIKVFESAVETIFKTDFFDETNPDLEPSPRFQVQVATGEIPKKLRELQSDCVGKVICVRGIITSTSKTNIRARKAVYDCTNCGHEFHQDIPFGLNRASPPIICSRNQISGPEKQNCRLNSYEMNTDKCEFIDQQIIKLQEAPEDIPTGEMPRSVMLTVDRELTDRCTPGNRIQVMGILSITKGNSKSDTSANKQVKQHVQRSYIKVLGLQSCMNPDGSPNAMGFAMPNITEEDQEKFEEMKRDPEIYEKIGKSVAPSIYGHPDIKKAIACLLFGGCAKKLPDGMRLRGDINILLLGDPSVAKSQFLKFVDRVAPVSVYTSGKGSSAAGLTASVIKDPATGDFQLEGGAMVLADGGVVCIDEFDKMRPQDRVAIHEAMEQQTISIAKAGITTILNSRSSVLAAANPLFGRYDDLKHAAEQIDFQSSILSRFDSIFIVKDVREEAIDKAIASHVLGLHMNAQVEESQAEISLDILRKYSVYAKMKVSPKLSEEACHMLQNMYVTDRANSKNQKISKKTNGIPITVRQLEAIIRISESIAKMHLEPIVHTKHVEEAHRIFKISTLNAASSGLSNGSTMNQPEEMRNMTIKIEEAIKRRVAIGTKISFPKLQQEMMMRFENQRAVDLAIFAMVKKGDFQHQEGRKILMRKVGVA